MPPDIEQLPLDLGDGIARLMRRFYPLLISRAFGDASGVLGASLAFDLSNPFVQEVLDELAKQVRGVAETTRDEIRSLIGKQADEGWSTAQLAEAIREHGEGISKSRAEMIARSETAAAYSKGSLLAYQESGVVSHVEWLLGPEPCVICEEIVDNTPRVALGETFYGDIAHPPAHPRCTCAIAPIVE